MKTSRLILLQGFQRQNQANCSLLWNQCANNHPCNWFNGLLPLTLKDNLESIEDIDVNGEGQTRFSVSNLTVYTITKAILSNTGQCEHPFAIQWSKLSNNEVLWFLAVIILDGLYPSPSMGCKFSSQSEDPVQGNDLFMKIVVQMLIVLIKCSDISLQYKCPKYKVNLFSNWLCEIWKEAWELRPNVSDEELTCWMQSQSIYKTQCCKFKWIGNGIQTNVIAKDWLFCNEPMPAKWIQKGLSPMHACLLHIFKIFMICIIMWIWTTCSFLCSLQSLQQCAKSKCSCKEFFGRIYKVFHHELSKRRWLARRRKQFAALPWLLL